MELGWNASDSVENAAFARANRERPKRGNRATLGQLRLRRQRLRRGVLVGRRVRTRFWEYLIIPGVFSSDTRLQLYIS